MEGNGRLEEGYERNVTFRSNLCKFSLQKQWRKCKIETEEQNQEISKSPYAVQYETKVV